MERKTNYRPGVYQVLLMEANTTIEAGNVAAINAGGYAVQASEAAGLVAVGVAEETVVSGAGEHRMIKVRCGIFLLDNSTADPVAATDVMKACYLIDGATVAKGNGAATEGGAAARSKAGTVFELEDGQVWVKIGG